MQNPCTCTLSHIVNSQFLHTFDFVGMFFFQMYVLDMHPSNQDSILMSVYVNGFAIMV